MLLESDCVDVNPIDETDRTPLHHSGHLSDAIKLLLENDKVDITSKTERGLTALSPATRGVCVDTAKVLLKHTGLDIDSKCDQGATPLSYVAGHARTIGGFGPGFSLEDSEIRRVEMAKALIECRAQVNSQDKDGRTPLVCAAMLGLKGVLDVLLEHGALVDLPDNDGRTPLCWAAMKGKLETFNVLLERDADIGVKDQSGCTLLILSVGGSYVGTRSLPDIRIVEFILAQKEVDINWRSKDGITALSSAIYSSSEDREIFHKVEQMLREH
ncbi:ankyrin repeat-containing domain protein [Pyronema domesticum]|nr:ankyrin repeat-containing domain protein [Pyronema domesticum]